MATPIFDDWMIGASVATLARFVDLGIPRPDKWTLQEYAVRNVKGNQQLSGHGFGNGALNWDTLGVVSAYKLLAFLGGALSATLYLRMPTNAAPSLGWANYQLVMQRPDLSGPDGAPIGGGVGGYTGFVIHLVGMVAQ